MKCRDAYCEKFGVVIVFWHLFRQVAARGGVRPVRRKQQSMCGIFGVVSRERPTKGELDTIHALQAHRGPDGVGSWSAQFGSRQVTLAFQRLAIIDLSPEAMQPFRCPETGSVIVFNGEIYNFVELRRDLEACGHKFRTRSDTEVLLRAFDHWGWEAGLQRLNGMFALAWLDGKSGTLKLARDRAGEKPLYYYSDDTSLVFASEIRTILGFCKGRRFRPNRKSISNLLRQSIADDSRDSFFEEIVQLGPGEAISIRPDCAGLKAIPAPYWQPNSQTGCSRLSIDDQVAHCRELLLDSVKIRLRSDVPVGFLLSGGIDSTSLVGLALESGIDPSAIVAFSAVGGDAATDESKWIDIACGTLGIRSNRISVSPAAGLEHFARTLDCTVRSHEEPFTSFSVVAQYEVMREAARSERTVILSGQGADELFCGYAKYSAFYIQQSLRRGQVFSAALTALQFAYVGTLLPQLTFDELKRYVPWLAVQGRSIDFLGPRLEGFPLESIGLGSGSLAERQLLDLRRFSVPMINHYEDRVSMAWSRELRMPFLDPRVIDFAISLPDEAKLRGGWTKYVLRKAMEPYIPRQIAWRRDKKGYTMPGRRWLRHELVPLLREIFQPDAFVFKHRYLDHGNFWRLYNDMTTRGGAGISPKEILGALTLELWMRSFHDHLDFSA